MGEAGSARALVEQLAANVDEVLSGLDRGGYARVQEGMTASAASIAGLRRTRARNDRERSFLQAATAPIASLEDGLRLVHVGLARQRPDIVRKARDNIVMAADRIALLARTLDAE